ncbi:hypothetical protein AGMMS49546_11650 [Spirochaetia bacterium]|nr:hypothetical protein AGMMS49546_11650 [Spirochaetia bacterium]
MSDPIASQDKLNRLYAQILKIDEDGKVFLKKIVTQAGANLGFPGMPASTGVDLPEKNKPKTGVEP